MREPGVGLCSPSRRSPLERFFADVGRGMTQGFRSVAAVFLAGFGLTWSAAHSLVAAAVGACLMAGLVAARETVRSVTPAVAPKPEPTPTPAELLVDYERLDGLEVETFERLDGHPDGSPPVSTMVSGGDFGHGVTWRVDTRDDGRWNHALAVGLAEAGPEAVSQALGKPYYIDPDSPWARHRSRLQEEAEARTRAKRLAFLASEGLDFSQHTSDELLELARRYVARIKQAIDSGAQQDATRLLAKLQKVEEEMRRRSRSRTTTAMLLPSGLDISGLRTKPAMQKRRNG